MTDNLEGHDGTLLCPACMETAREGAKTFLDEIQGKTPEEVVALFIAEIFLSAKQMDLDNDEFTERTLRICMSLMEMPSVRAAARQRQRRHRAGSN